MSVSETGWLGSFGTGLQATATDSVDLTACDSHRRGRQGRHLRPSLEHPIGPQSAGHSGQSGTAQQRVALNVFILRSPGPEVHGWLWPVARPSRGSSGVLAGYA